MKIIKNAKKKQEKLLNKQKHKNPGSPPGFVVSIYPLNSWEQAENRYKTIRRPQNVA